MPEDPLALDTRRRVYEAVRRAPGSGAREVQRAAGMAWGETNYHLERLVGTGLLHRESSGHQDHYYTAEVPLGDRRLLALVRSESVRRLILVLLEDPDRTVPELMERSALSGGRLSVHLRRLLELGIVRSARRGRFRTYAVVDRERAIRLLITYRAGLSDNWLERLAETWSELFRA